MLPNAESFRRLVDGRTTGFLATLSRAGLSAIEIPYEAIVRLRNYGYDQSIFASKRASVSVISVGKLSHFRSCSLLKIGLCFGSCLINLVMANFLLTCS